MDYALDDISYVNAIMYSRALPMYGDEDEDDGVRYDASKDACNPANFGNFEGEQVVRA